MCTLVHYPLFRRSLSKEDAMSTTLLSGPTAVTALQPPRLLDQVAQAGAATRGVGADGHADCLLGACLRRVAR